MSSAMVQPVVPSCTPIVLPTRSSEPEMELTSVTDIASFCVTSAGFDACCAHPDIMHIVTSSMRADNAAAILFIAEISFLK